MTVLPTQFVQEVVAASGFQRVSKWHRRLLYYDHYACDELIIYV